MFGGTGVVPWCARGLPAGSSAQLKVLTIRPPVGQRPADWLALPRRQRHLAGLLCMTCRRHSVRTKLSTWPQRRCTAGSESCLLPLCIGECQQGSQPVIVKPPSVLAGVRPASSPPADPGWVPRCRICMSVTSVAPASSSDAFHSSWARQCRQPPEISTSSRPLRTTR